MFYHQLFYRWFILFFFKWNDTIIIWSHSTAVNNCIRFKIASVSYFYFEINRLTNPDVIRPSTTFFSPRWFYLNDSRLNQDKYLRTKGDLKALNPQVIHKCHVFLFHFPMSPQNWIWRKLFYMSFWFFPLLYHFRKLDCDGRLHRSGTGKLVEITDFSIFQCVFIAWD